MEWFEGYAEGKSRALTSQIQGNQRLQWRSVHGCRQYSLPLAWEL